MGDSGDVIGHEEVERRGAFFLARETGTKFKVVCPFARAQFARDPSIRDVLG